MSTSQDQQTLDQFAQSLKQDVWDACGENPEEPDAMPTAFTALILEDFKRESEILDSTKVSPFNRNVRPEDRGTATARERMKVSAIGVNEERGQADLVVTIHMNRAPATTLTTQQISRPTQELVKFTQLALAGKLKDSYADMGESAYKLIEKLHDYRDQIERINLFVITDQLLPSTGKPEVPPRIEGKDVSLQLWGLSKIRALRDGHLDEPVDIDFVSDFGESISCISAVEGEGEYQAYMAVIPGHVIYESYEKFRTRLLEENVRHFLQDKGKVNRGILTTIKQDPEKFFAYNNGITTIASAVEFAGQGKRRIRSVKGWQIVNGGQTTASIHVAGNDMPEALKKISVPAKIIVVSPQNDSGALVSSISRFSNSQNKVVESDFASNLPYFKALESLSRDEWIRAPGTDAQSRTRWYFERTKGQYNTGVQLARFEQGGMAKFRRQNPKPQQFNKLDLAKSENSWLAKPHIVSLGNERNFADYEKIISSEPALDIEEYKQIIGRLILFRSTESIIKANLKGDFRNNILAYTVATLSLLTDQSIDMLRIYKNQGLGGAMSTMILNLAKRIVQLINEGASQTGMTNIGEWCKKQGCWEIVKSSIPEIQSNLTIPQDAMLKTPVLSPPDQSDQAFPRDEWSVFLTNIKREQWTSLINLRMNLERGIQVSLVSARGYQSKTGTSQDNREWEFEMFTKLGECLSVYRAGNYDQPDLNTLFDRFEQFQESVNRTG